MLSVSFGDKTDREAERIAATESQIYPRTESVEQKMGLLVTFGDRIEIADFT